MSALDPTVGVREEVALQLRGTTAVGYTEWAGTYCAEPIYIWWNWGVMRMSIIVLSPAAIRTNIQLVENGMVESQLLTRAHMLEWIETLPWRDAIAGLIMHGE